MTLTKILTIGYNLLIVLSNNNLFFSLYVYEEYFIIIVDSCTIDFYY